MNVSKEVGRPRTVAEYLDWQIHLCGRKQRDMAKDMGFDKPNIITMIKQGKTKLPLDKVGRMAKAIGVDPIFLFRMCMNEYMPETWTAIEHLLEQPIVTRNEMAIVEVIREANPGNPKLITQEERETLKNFAANLKGDNETVDEEEYK